MIRFEGEQRVARPTVTETAEGVPPEFRAKLYQNYANLTERAAAPETGEAIGRAMRVLSYHFRERLPADRAAPILDAACGADAFLDALKEMN